MKKTFFIAMAFVCFSNFAFANDSLSKINPTKQALTNHPIELIIKQTEQTRETSIAKSEDTAFTFCYEIGRSTSVSHGVSITTVYSRCTVYSL
jgi:cobyrinic acid a,c-diamide synthase